MREYYEVLEDEENKDKEKNKKKLIGHKFF